MRATVDASLAATGAVGAPTTWVLSNHDVVRHVTRYGGGEQGLRRARAAALLTLALPGSAYLYQGEELGLPEVTDLPDEVRQDPRLLPRVRPGRLPRRLPGADPVDGGRPLVRFRRGRALAAAAGVLAGPVASPPSRATRTRRWSSTARRSPCAANCRASATAR